MRVGFAPAVWSHVEEIMYKSTIVICCAFPSSRDSATSQHTDAASPCRTWSSASCPQRDTRICSRGSPRANVTNPESSWTQNRSFHFMSTLDTSSRIPPQITLHPQWPGASCVHFYWCLVFLVRNYFIQSRSAPVLLALKFRFSSIWMLESTS